MVHWRVVLGIFIALLLGTCVAVAARAAGSQAGAQDAWRIYTNAKYGYRISYPVDFEIVLTGNDRERDGRSFRVVRRNHAAPVPMLDVDLAPNRSIGPRAPAFDKAPVFTVARTEIVLDGRQGTQSVYRFDPSGETARVVIDLGDVRFSFAASTDTQDLRATPWWKIIESFHLRR